MKTMELCRKILVGLSGLLVLGALTNSAWAGDCTYIVNSTGGHNFTAGQATYAFTVPVTVALTGTEAVGTVLWTSPPASGDKAVAASCPGGVGSAGLVDFWGTTSTVAGTTNVMPTNVAGVGYAIQWASAGLGSGIQGYPANGSTLGATPNSGLPGGIRVQATLIFVKTAEAYFSGTSAATNRSGDFSTWYVGTNRLRFINFTVSNPTTFTKPDGGGGGGGGGGGAATCRINNASVELGTASASTFGAVGSKGTVRSVPIAILCRGRVTSMTLAFSSATGTVADMDGVATLSNLDGVATGVGVVLLRSDGVTAVRFGAQNRVTFFNDSSGSFANPSFNAALIKIASQVTGGTVKSAMIATLTFN